MCNILLQILESNEYKSSLFRTDLDWVETQKELLHADILSQRSGQFCIHTTSAKVRSLLQKVVCNSELRKRVEEAHLLRLQDPVAEAYAWCYHQSVVWRSKWKDMHEHNLSSLSPKAELSDHIDSCDGTSTVMNKYNSNSALPDTVGSFSREERKNLPPTLDIVPRLDTEFLQESSIFRMLDRLSFDSFESNSNSIVIKDDSTPNTYRSIQTNRTLSTASSFLSKGYSPDEIHPQRFSRQGSSSSMSTSGCGDMSQSHRSTVKLKSLEHLQKKTKAVCLHLQSHVLPPNLSVLPGIAASPQNLIQSHRNNSICMANMETPLAEIKQPFFEIRKNRNSSASF